MIFLSLFALILFNTSIFAQTVLVSQYVEAISGNSPKAFELWNASGQDIDLSQKNITVNLRVNLTAPALKLTINTGIFKNDDVIVIGTPDVGTYLTATGLTNVRFISTVTGTTNNVDFNGDDAIIVNVGGVQSDVFGDPTQATQIVWTANGVSSQNGNIQLKSGITTGSTGWSDPSLRFENVFTSTAPNSQTWLKGFGVKPTSTPTNFTDLYFNDFQSATSLAPFTNYSKTSSAKVWKDTTIGTNKFVYANGFISTTAPGNAIVTDCWLISPKFDAAAYGNLVLSMSIQRNFTGPDIEVYVSNNYSGSGDPSLATWTNITNTALLATYQNSVWYSGGYYNLDPYISSNLYVAVRYYTTGGGSSNAKNYYLDNFYLFGTLAVPPTKLNVLNTVPANPFAGLGFKLNVNTLDNSNNIQRVIDNRNIQVNLLSGTGTLSGQTNATISQFTSSASLDLSYNKKENITVQVVDNTASPLNSSQVYQINFVDAPQGIKVTNLYPKVHAGNKIPTFTIEAYNSDGTINGNYDGYDVSLTTESGSPIMTYTPVKFKFGVATISDLIINTPGTYKLSASTIHYTSTNNPTIVVLGTPTFNELIVPKYMLGNRKPDDAQNFDERMASYALVELKNLHPNTSYRYTTHVSLVDYNGTGQANTTLQGNVNFDGVDVHYNALTNTYQYNKSGLATINWTQTFPCLNVDGPGYSILQSDANGNAKVWLNVVPSAANTFASRINRDVYWIMTLGDEFGNLIRRYQTNNNSHLIKFWRGDGYDTPYGAKGAENDKDATPIYDLESKMTAKNFVALYSDNDKSGMPLVTAIVQGDGVYLQTVDTYNSTTCVPTTWFEYAAPPYMANLDGNYDIINFKYVPEKQSSWGTYIPNVLRFNVGDPTKSSSLNKIVELDYQGNVVSSKYDPDGVWAGTNTNNPYGDYYTGIEIKTPQIYLNSFNSGKTEYCNTEDGFVISWNSRGVRNVDINIYNALTNQVIATYSNLDAVNDASTGNGFFKWNVPYTQFSEKLLYIRISNTESSTQYVQSDNFTIYDAAKFISQSQSAIACEGDTRILSVAAKGSNVSLQWYKDGKVLVGETKQQLILSNLRFDQSGVYTCNLIGSAICGNKLSANIPVYVARATEITQQPTNKYAYVNGSATFTFEVHGNGLPPNYKFDIQWYKNGKALADNAQIAGSRSNSLSIEKLTNADLTANDEYWASVKGLCGEVLTAKVKLIKSDVEITLVNDKFLTCENDLTVIKANVNANSNLDLNYQWTANGIDLADNGNYTGSNTSELTISKTRLENVGNYKLVITSKTIKDFKIESKVARVEIIELPTITSQPPFTLQVPVNKTLAIGIAAKGSNLKYQWYQNNAIIPNSNSQNYNVLTATTDDAGEYYCLVYNECDTVQSTKTVVAVSAAGLSGIENELDNGNIKLYDIYPNPANENSSLTFFTKNEEKVSIEIYAVTGNLIASIFDSNSNVGINTININNLYNQLQTGTYYYRLSSRYGSLWNKFVVSK